MRPGLLILLLVLTSCGQPVTLFTDGVFQAAAPEIVKAWSDLSRYHNARTVQLARPTADALRRELGQQSGPALIGAALTPAERATLSQAFPRIRLVFFVPAKEAAGQADMAVDRDSAWTLVAKKAAAEAPGAGATALFPADATPLELDGFARAWKQAGGGLLTPLVWPVTAIPAAPLFQWAGSAADTLVQGLPPGTAVHGDPGTKRPTGSTGLTWSLREDALGALLWKASQDNEKTTYFLSLEAVPDLRDLGH